MKTNDKDVAAFLGLMPPDIKQRMIVCIEAVYGDTIERHKERAIQEAEALIVKIQQNPEEYTNASVHALFSESIGNYPISEDLRHRIEVVTKFIGHRSIIETNTDGTVEERNNVSFEDFINSESYKFLFESSYSKRNRRKKH
jgi:hypothetical protein